MTLVVSQAEDAFWAALVAAAFHPVEVEIIEAMRWISQPLTAVDLLHILERSGLRIERRLRRLVRLNAVAPEDNGVARGPLAQIRYRLVEMPRPRQ